MNTGTGQPRGMNAWFRAMVTTCALVAFVPAARAAHECRYSVEHASDGREQTVTRTLGIGEIDRTAPATPLRIVNHGEHDLRLTFDGAPPRLLQRGAAEPAIGRITPGVVLRGVECLPTRS